MINPNEFEEEWGWAPDYGYDVIKTNDPDGKIAERQAKKSVEDFEKRLETLLKNEVK